MKHLSKIIMIAGVLVPLLFGNQQVNATSNIGVQLNGQALYFDQPPLLENGRVLVPMRTIFEVVGADVEWVAQTLTVKAKKGDLSITLPLNSKQATINGNKKNLDVPAKITNGRTLVPLRFVSEALGCNVNWDNKRKVVSILFNGKIEDSNIRYEDLPFDERIPITGDISTIPDVKGETNRPSSIFTKDNQTKDTEELLPVPVYDIRDGIEVPLGESTICYDFIDK